MDAFKLLRATWPQFSVRARSTPPVSGSPHPPYDLMQFLAHLVRSGHPDGLLSVSITQVCIFHSGYLYSLPRFLRSESAPSFALRNLQSWSIK